MLAQHLPHPSTLLLGGHAQASEQLALAVDRRSGDHPSHGEALEQQLDRALPGMLLRRRCPLPDAGEGPCVLAARSGRQRPAERQHVALAVGVLAARGYEPLVPAAAPAHPQAASAARSSAERTSPVTAPACPGTGAPSPGAVPRWSVWPCPSTTRRMPPRLAPALATARVIVRAPASNSVTPPSSSIRKTLHRPGCPWTTHTPWATSLASPGPRLLVRRVLAFNAPVIRCSVEDPYAGIIPICRANVIESVKASLLWISPSRTVIRSKPSSSIGMPVGATPANSPGPAKVPVR